MGEVIKPGSVIEINGLPGKWIAIDPEQIKYDYVKSKCDCPLCKGLGVPWGGWFHCEDCQHVGLVDTGQIFAKLRLE